MSSRLLLTVVLDASAVLLDGSFGKVVVLFLMLDGLSALHARIVEEMMVRDIRPKDAR